MSMDDLALLPRQLEEERAARKKAEDLLEEKVRELTLANQLLQRYLDSVPCMVVALDTRACISMINRAGCALLGQPESALLGQAWFEETGLPFVFAAWAVAPDLPTRIGLDGIRELGELLAAARDWGLARVPALAAREAGAGCLGPGGEATPAALEYYFSHSLRYRLGDEELAGMRRFRDLCAAHGLMEPTAGPVQM